MTHRTLGKEKPEKRAAKAGGRRERSEREVARKFYRFVNSKQKNEFLNIYIETGTIGRAAKASGITRQTHYNWLKEDAAYKKAFGEAKEMAGDLLEEEAYRRAVDGTEMCVYYKGKKVDSYRKMSDAHPAAQGSEAGRICRKARYENHGRNHAERSAGVERSKGANQECSRSSGRE